MGPYPNWRQVARKRIVTEDADFDHHSLAAVATISAQAPALADPRERTFVSPEQRGRAERHPNSQIYELARAPMSPSGRKTGGYRPRSMQPAIAIRAGSSMISVWAPALDHRHPTYSRSYRLTKLIHAVQNRRDPYPRPMIQSRARSPPATSCPAICRTRSGTSMITNSTNCYQRLWSSRSDGAGGSPLKSPSRGASKWFAH